MADFDRSKVHGAEVALQMHPTFYGILRSVYWCSKDFASGEMVMLEKELEFLSAHREELAKEYPGRFLIIKGEEVAGAYETREAALAAAGEQFGFSNVLIRRAEDADQLISIPALTYGLIDARI
jgi:hypothetical protein